MFHVSGDGQKMKLIIITHVVFHYNWISILLLFCLHDYDAATW